MITDFCGHSKLKIYDDKKMKPYKNVIHTYSDHRIAMTFAPLAIAIGEIKIDDPGVVKKSYPGFWDQMKRIGFIVSALSQ